MTNAEAVVAALKEKGWHISFAESCTAGYAAGELVTVPSASAVLDVSFVTYANEAKEKYVHVAPETLARYGAVSEQVAGEMARGCAAEGGAEVGVGISGIAGPGGGTKEKPVGTVCFGFAVEGNVRTVTKHFPSGLDREGVRRASVAFVYEVLVSLLGDEGTKETGETLLS